MLVMFTHTTLDMLLKALILEKEHSRLWQLTIGKNYRMKLKISIFPRKAKQYLLKKQMSS